MITRFDGDIRRILEQLVEEALVSAEILADELDEYVENFSGSSLHMEFVDREKADRCTMLCRQLLKELPNPPDEHRHRLTQLAINYYVLAEDAADDKHSMVGFDDDLQVVEAVVEELGLQHLLETDSPGDSTLCDCSKCAAYFLFYTECIPVVAGYRTRGEKMNNKIIAFATGGLLVLAALNSALAQDAGQRSLVSVDLWACSFNDRQDMGDLDDWVDKFNAWLEENDSPDYAAWTLTPAYWGPNQNFNFIWLGVWPNGNAMGQGWDQWNAGNGGLMDEFLAISTCSAHNNFASIAHRLPEGLDNSGNGVLAISDCKVADGTPQGAVGRAMRQWVNVLNEAESNAAIYHWFPVFGGGGANFDFKEVTAYQNYTDLGADYERMGNGGLVRQKRGLLGHLAQCDEARVYNSQSRRFIDVRAGQRRD
jgi:uncharacterized membrane protein YkvA (DUF1232 family)